MIATKAKDGNVTFKRENWKEMFNIKVTEKFIQTVREGHHLPRFFLPVRRVQHVQKTICWLFPLAPFALIFYIIRDMLGIMWQDLLFFGDDLRRWMSVKKKTKKK